MAGAAHRALGFDLAIAARLPSVLGGALTVTMTFLLARRWYGVAPALAASGVLATTALFEWAARSAQLDSLLAAATTGALFCAVRAADEDSAARRTLWTAGGYLSAGLGVLVKGPTAVAIPGVVLLVHRLATQPRRVLSPALAWGPLIAATPGLLWLLAARESAGPGYAESLVLGHAVGHAAGAFDKLEPWWFYPADLPVRLLPWTLLLPAALLARPLGRSPREAAADRFVFAWLVAPIVLLSLVPAKRELYLVPVHPAVALLLARWLRAAASVPALVRSAWAAWPGRLIAAGATLLGGALVLASAAALLSGPAGLGVAPLDQYLSGLRVAPVGLALGALLGAAALVSGASALRAGAFARGAGALVASVGLVQLAMQASVIPARDPEQSVRPFLETVGRRIGDAPLARYGGDGGLQYAVNWVLRRDVVPELHDPDAAAEFLRASAGPRFVVTDLREMARLGAVPGAAELLVVERRRQADLVLLGRKLDPSVR